VLGLNKFWLSFLLLCFIVLIELSVELVNIMLDIYVVGIKLYILFRDIQLLKLIVLVEFLFLFWFLLFFWFQIRLDVGFVIFQDLRGYLLYLSIVDLILLVVISVYQEIVLILTFAISFKKVRNNFKNNNMIIN
jgi:hypothetical protein